MLRYYTPTPPKLHPEVQPGDDPRSETYPTVHLFSGGPKGKLYWQRFRDELEPIVSVMPKRFRDAFYGKATSLSKEVTDDTLPTVAEETYSEIFRCDAKQAQSFSTLTVLLLAYSLRGSVI